VLTQSNNMVKAKKSKKTDNSKINGAKPVGMATNNSDNPNRCVSLDYHSPALPMAIPYFSKF